MLELNNVYHLDCLIGLDLLEDNSIDSIIVDSPYFIGFMGKEFDKVKDNIALNIEVWKKCYKKLKPGGYLLTFGACRSHHRLWCCLEDAGFNIRETLMWVFGSGFPKSLSIGKQIDKKLGNKRKSESVPNYKNQLYGKGMGGGEWNAKVEPPISQEAKNWDGWGTNTKPAYEPICMAQKPISEKTIVDNVLLWGTGAINIQDSRVDYAKNDRLLKGGTYGGNRLSGAGTSIFGNGEKSVEYGDGVLPPGRWPSNIIFDESAGQVLDEQTGTLKSGFMAKGTPRQMSANPNKICYGEYKPDTVENETYGDSGGASRFFKNINYTEEELVELSESICPYFYCGKASRSEREQGLDNLESHDQRMEWNSIQDARPHTKEGYVYEGKKIRNTGPCVKPIKLLEYLCKLVTPPGGTILDIFAGTGSLGVAAENLNFNYILFEKELEYFTIAEARIQHAKNKKIVEKTESEKLKDQMELFDSVG